jgi:hypothetical protein
MDVRMSTITRDYGKPWPTSDGGCEGREIVREITGKVFRVNGKIIWREVITQVMLTKRDANGNIEWEVKE